MTASREACRHFLVSFSNVKDDLIVSWFFSSNGKYDDQLGGPGSLSSPRFFLKCELIGCITTWCIFKDFENNWTSDFVNGYMQYIKQFTLVFVFEEALNFIQKYWHVVRPCCLMCFHCNYCFVVRPHCLEFLHCLHKLTMFCLDYSLDWLLFKDLNVFVVGWHVLGKNLNNQGKVTTDNQQVNVVGNEEEIEVEQIIIIYIPTFEGKP